MSQLPDYYTIWHKAGHYGLRIMAALVLIFLMLPILGILALVLAKPELGEIPVPGWLAEPLDRQLPFDVPRR